MGQTEQLCFPALISDHEMSVSAGHVFIYFFENNLEEHKNLNDFHLSTQKPVRALFASTTPRSTTTTTTTTTRASSVTTHATTHVEPSRLVTTEESRTRANTRDERDDQSI